MILAIDIGNTNIFIGAIDNKKTYFVERITTTIGKTNLEYAITLKSILEIYQIEPKEIEGGIISSVVPPLNRTLISAVRKITGIYPKLVGSGMKTGLNILMDNPKSVGSDMIVNSIGALGAACKSAAASAVSQSSSSCIWRQNRPMERSAAELTLASAGMAPWRMRLRA